MKQKLIKSNPWESIQLMNISRKKVEKMPNNIKQKCQEFQKNMMRSDINILLPKKKLSN